MRKLLSFFLRTSAELILELHQNFPINHRHVSYSVALINHHRVWEMRNFSFISPCALWRTSKKQIHLFVAKIINQPHEIFNFSYRSFPVQHGRDSSVSVYFSIRFRLSFVLERCFFPVHSLKSFV